jgi:hypothetical protein
MPAATEEHYRFKLFTVAPSRFFFFFFGGMLHSNENASQFVHGIPRLPASHRTCYYRQDPPHEEGLLLEQRLEPYPSRMAGLDMKV